MTLMMSLVGDADLSVRTKLNDEMTDIEEPERAESFTRGWKKLMVRNRDIG